MGGEVVSTEAMFAELKRCIDDMPRILGDQLFEKCRTLIKAEVQTVLDPVMARLVALESAMTVVTVSYTHLTLPTICSV
eukprot:4817102-Alexandrium_andersonii.AAC.1